MPIVANPAAPFAPQINSKFAAADQWNKAFPALAGLYEAAGRNYTQASAQTAQNQTSASAVSAGLEGRRIAQDKEIEAEMQARQFQAQVEMEKQQRAQQFELARQMIPITAAENQHNTAMMNGLAELDRQVDQKYLTEEQAAPYRYELVTGINQFQRRQQAQQANMLKQKAEMEAQQVATMQKNQMLGEQFMLETGKMGGTLTYFTDHTTGRVHPMAWDSINRKYYNPFLEHAGTKGEKEPQTEDQKWQASYTTKGGQFDFAAAEKRSESLVKHDPDYAHLRGDKEKMDAQVSKNVQGMYDVWLQGKEGQQGQQTPVTAPQQQAPQQAPVQQPMAPEAQQMAQRYPGEVEQMAKKGLPPVIIESVVKDMAEVERIMSSKPYAQLSEREKGYLATLKEEIKRRMAAGSK